MHWWYCHALSHQVIFFNSLWPTDTIWQHATGLTLAQVMTCCLTAPSHYLSQCWLMITDVQWQFCNRYLSHQLKTLATKLIFKILFKFPRGQWVKDCFIHGTGTIIWLSESQWSNAEETTSTSAKPQRNNISPNSKVHGANMGPTWVLSAPDGPHVGPMNLAIRV